MRILSRRPVKVDDLANLRPTSAASMAKRYLRTPLLAAFDIYKSNVAYGVEKEDQAQHTRILEWYRSLLELEEDAFTQVPPEITKYVKGGM